VNYQYLEHRISGGVGADDRYWQGLEEGRFLLPRCAGCDKWMWPAHWRCGECGAWDLDWTEVQPYGTVYAWSRTWYAFDRVKERAAQVPYVVVLAKIPHAGNSRVLGVLKGPDEGLKIGAPVHGVIDPPARESKGYATVRWVLGDAKQGEGLG
jgi:uncharacterized OB-fold protein